MTVMCISLHLSPMHTLNFHHMQLVFYDVIEPKMYYSLDEGATFVAQIFYPETISVFSLKFHPLKENWILGVDKINNQVNR